MHICIYKIPKAERYCYLYMIWLHLQEFKIRENMDNYPYKNSVQELSYKL